MCIHIQEKKTNLGKANRTTLDTELYSVVVTSSVQESNPVHWPKVQETLRQNHTSLTLRLLTILTSCCDTQYCGVQKHTLTLSKALLILPWSSATNRMPASAICMQIMLSCAQHRRRCLWKWSNQNMPSHTYFIQVTSDACKNTVVMRLSVQKKTLHNYERPLDGEASLEENKKWIEQIIKKRREGRREGMKWKYN